MRRRSRRILGKKKLIAAEREQFVCDTNLVKYLDAVEARYDKRHAAELEFVAELRRNCNSKNDRLFYYEYHKAKKEEEGWIILEGCRLKSKCLIAGTSE